MPDTIDIVDYHDRYHKAFRQLNLEWIEHYFTVEPEDVKVLDHPKENILDKGGLILVALFNGLPVGVCALLKSEHSQFDFELAKMGVSPKVQGKGIGLLLGQSIIKRAKQLGGENIFLESHHSLKAALHLYKKLGFEEIKGVSTPYERSDIQMALYL